MTTENKRKLVVQGALSRAGKNIYSQHYEKRYLIEDGYGDCSSTVRHWFKTLIGIDIGLNTESQINSKLGKKVNLQINNGVPDESKMKLGDCLYFRGDNAGRTDGVGHVEMYIGNGQIFGHGSGKGGTIKKMNSYCESRQKSKSKSSALKNRGLICVIRFINDDEDVKNVAKSDKPLNSQVDNKDLDRHNETYKVKSGDSLSKIAKKYNITIDDIVKMNNIKNPNIINVGQELIVGTYQIYRVIKGDTLSKISLKLLGNVNRYKEIMELNGLKNTVLSIGQELKIPNK